MSIMHATEPGPGGVVITVNRRLARFLSREYDAMQIAAHKTSWEPPDILPWSAWLARCLEELHDKIYAESPDEVFPIVLTPAQENLLWERIILDCQKEALLLRVTEAAQKAREAWNLLQAFQVELHHDDASENEDSLIWLRWADRFEAELNRNHWLAVANLPDFVARNLNRLTLPKTIHLAGFDHLTPQQQSLMDRLAKSGVAVTSLITSSLGAKVVQTTFGDQETEIRAAATWCRCHLQANINTKSCTTAPLSIAVVIPELGAIRSRVVRIFQEIFYPDEPDTSQAWESLPFNLSLGVPLTEAPLVRDALLLLEMGKGTLTTASYGRLLASPFLAGGEKEWSSRALLDARLRANGRLTITVEQLLHAARGGLETPPCPLLVSLLQQFIAQRLKNKKNESMGTTREWAMRFVQWLAWLGWPGERVLESTEYQAMTSWREALMTFASLDRVWGSMGLSHALDLLRRHLAETLFQPETKVEAPIQILGMLEAAGERFDKLWILGLTEDLWPPVPQPNPFLPISLQRRYGFPKSSGEHELLFAKEILDGLWQSAREVIVSHPAQDEDREVRLSPLAKHLPKVMITQEELFPDYAGMIQDVGVSELMVDWQGVPFGHATKVAGGAGVLQAQARCPFQAFARFRLQAHSLEQPQPGLNGAIRGELVHLMLKKFWTGVQSLEKLLDLVPEEWEANVRQAIDEALNDINSRWPDALSKAGRELEQNRLLRLLNSWIELESRRTIPFEVIKQEETAPFNIGGIELTLRMDRVDRLPDNRLVILDYKTGKIVPRLVDWFVARPREPQLPLYCLALSEKTAGLAFGHLLPQDTRFIGIGQEEAILPGISAFHAMRDLDFANWDAILAHWQGVFTELAQAFRQGDAQPDPLPDACDACDLLSLCRHGDDKIV